MNRNLYLHADGDAFFVACELVERPELRGRPVVVGGDRGIAVAMSQEAKKLGVTRGMPSFKIKKHYPEVLILPHNFDLYRKIGTETRRILSSYLDTVETYSIDECFALVTPADLKYFGGEEKLVRDIKNEIQVSTGVTYSFGLARTKALAKTASKLEKPNGLVLMLTKKDEERGLKQTSIEDLWGIGRRTYPRLQNMGVRTAFDFIQMSDKILEKNFSSGVLELKLELSGESVLSVTADEDNDPRDQKSLQSTSTFRPSSSDPKVIWTELSQNVEEACERIREINLFTKSVSFFVKNMEFVYRTGEVNLPLYSADPGVILDAIEPVFKNILKKGEKIRSTGITLKSLVREEDVPRDLFGKQDVSLSRLAVERAADKIRTKYGKDSIKRASSMR